MVGVNSAILSDHDPREKPRFCRYYRTHHDLGTTPRYSRTSNAADRTLQIAKINPNRFSKIRPWNKDKNVKPRDLGGYLTELNETWTSREFETMRIPLSDFVLTRTSEEFVCYDFSGFECQN